MAKLSIEDLVIEGKRVLMRVDFNVPVDSEGNVIDATRIEAALPSIRYVLEKGGALILMSHLGRPGGVASPEFSLGPCAKVLEGLLEHPVQFAPDCVGERVAEMARHLQPGQVLLLENVRFHRAESHPEEDHAFAKALASLGDLYVNDAFGSAHRKHSSTYSIAHYFPGKAAAGFLLQKEILFLGETLSHPNRPFCALIGGAKISTKIGVLKSLLGKVDHLLIGGGMSYTFFKAQGIEIGDSICEDQLLSVAKEILELAKERNIPLHLPVDIMTATECSEDAPAKLVGISQGIPPGYQGLDIGPKTVEQFSTILKKAKTILWNGPVGVFEFERFAAGTNALAQIIAESSATTIVGGGDSLAALNSLGLAPSITHISTGGGATLEYIEFGTLPALNALSEKTTVTPN